MHTIRNTTLAAKFKEEAELDIEIGLLTIDDPLGTYRQLVAELEDGADVENEKAQNSLDVILSLKNDFDAGRQEASKTPPAVDVFMD